MRKLRRQPKPGRAAVVVPNGTLFGDGVCARIKEELLKEFNLHTIVRLPNGVFAPYTSIPTNLLFFDRSGPTKDVWYYEQPLPEGRKNYTKTQPIQFEEFADCLAWWNKREGERPGLESARRQDPRATAATWTSRTPTPRTTSSTFRRSSWSRTSFRRSCASRRSCGRSKCSWVRGLEQRPPDYPPESETDPPRRLLPQPVVKNLRNGRGSTSEVAENKRARPAGPVEGPSNPEVQGPELDTPASPSPRSPAKDVFVPFSLPCHVP